MTSQFSPALSQQVSLPAASTDRPFAVSGAPNRSARAQAPTLGLAHRTGHSCSLSGIRMPGPRGLPGRLWSLGNVADVAAGLAKDTNHPSTAVVASLKNRRGQGHQPPEQIEGLLGIRPGHRLHDCTALSIEIIDQGPDALPVDKRPRPRNDRKPFAY